MKSKNIVGAIAGAVIKIGIVVLIIIGVYRAALFAYDFGFRIFAEKPVSPEPGITMSVAVVEGKTGREIGKILEEKGLIRSADVFYVQEMLSPYKGKLLPGIYELNTSMTSEEMMKIMAGESEEYNEAHRIEEEAAGTAGGEDDPLGAGDDSGEDQIPIEDTIPVEDTIPTE